MAKKTRRRDVAGKEAGKGDRSGAALEKAVARIQEMIDPTSKVTRNEKLVDRIGNAREFDVVVRGTFGGRPMLGVLECRDHNRKKGPADVEGFSKKCENLNANLRIMVSRKGFTPRALRLAKHEGVGCFSLLPPDTELKGFSVGQYWYAQKYLWTTIRLAFELETGGTPVGNEVPAEEIRYQGQPICRWFLRELMTTCREEAQTGEHVFAFVLKAPLCIEILNERYNMVVLRCHAQRVCQLKRKWVSWHGDGVYDWHASAVTIPGGGQVISAGVETDVSTWDDFEGVLPEPSSSGIVELRIIVHQAWMNGQDVVELGELGALERIAVPSGVIGGNSVNESA